MRRIQLLIIIFISLFGSFGEVAPLWAKQKGKKKNAAVQMTEFVIQDTRVSKKRTPHKMRIGFGKNRIHVQLQPQLGDGPFQFGKRVLRDWQSRYKDILKYNHNRPLQAGRYVTFPFKSLNGTYQSIVLRGLFANDTIEEEGWGHRITYPGETLSFIVGVFAKQGISSYRVAKYNKLKNQGNIIAIGDTIIIPWKWLRPDLDLKPVAVRLPLTRSKDPKDLHAYYQLKKGETIYSSVIRFTGRILPAEVSRLSEQLLTLNKIADPKKIHLRKKIKIPLEWVSEEYLVAKSNQQLAAVVKKKTKASRPRTLAEQHPIHIILDAGHGGNDPGAISGSAKRGDLVYEDEVVYDISLRMMALLKSQGYVVHPTVKDPTQSKPRKKLLTKDRDEVLLVHPNYGLADSGIGVNFRVYLANHLYKKLVTQKKVPKENIIFMSLHGDARHKSLRGAMVYYPDARLRMKVFGLRNKVYRKRKEYARRIWFPQKENRHTAQSSKAFGQTIIETLRAAKVVIHSPKPLRSYHYRKGRRTLPAILRYSKVPTSVLVEVANLTNAQDRRAILQSKNRQKIAESLVQSIHNHFQEKFGLRVAAR